MPGWNRNIPEVGSGGVSTCAASSTPFPYGYLGYFVRTAKDDGREGHSCVMPSQP